MSFVQTFSGVLAPVRSDNVPWTNVYVQEASSASGPWTTISTQAWTDLNPATAEPTTITVTTATLESGWYRMYWTDGASAASPHTAAVYTDSSTSTNGWLLTLSELRTLLGVDPTYTLNDDKYLAMIGGVSEAIRTYTGRDLGLPVAVEERTYFYDGSGFVDIDDATDVTLVKFAYPYSAPDITLTTDDYTVRDSPVYTYIELPGYTGHPWGSPEMGFKFNLDTYVRDRGAYALPKQVKVDGTWGWAEVPDDVKMAAAWVIQSWATRASTDNMTSEAIEGWARSWGNKTASLAIPEAARDILSAYTRIDA
jgi:hypothetical protein